MITGRLVVLKLEISDILPTSGIIFLMTIMNGVLGYRIGYVKFLFDYITPRGVEMTFVGVSGDED